MARDPVELWIGRLLRAAEPKMVGHDRAVARLRQRADEVPVQEAPGRVAMHQYDRAAIPRPLVDVVHPPVGRLEPARLKPPQPPESPVLRHSRHNSRPSLPKRDPHPEDEILLKRQGSPSPSRSNPPGSGALGQRW